MLGPINKTEKKEHLHRERKRKREREEWENYEWTTWRNPATPQRASKNDEWSECNAWLSML